MGNAAEEISKLSIDDLVKTSQETRQQFFQAVKMMNALPAPEEVVVDDEFIHDAEEEMQRMTLEVPTEELGDLEEVSMEDQLMGKSKSQEVESDDELSMEEQLMGKSKASKDDEEESLEDQLMGKSKAKDPEPDDELSMEEQLMGKAKASKDDDEEESLEDQLMAKSKSESSDDDEPERMTLTADDLAESEAADNGISDDEIANLSSSIEESVQAEVDGGAVTEAEKEHVVVDHPNEVDQETIDRLMAEAKAKAHEVDVKVKRFDIELEPPKEFLDIHLDIEAAESLKVVSKFKAIFEQKRQELEEGMAKAGSDDSGALDQSELDNLLGGGEPADDGNEVLNQDELDALFAGNDANGEAKTEEPSDDGNEVLNQDELDALFAGNDANDEAKIEESSDDGNEVLNQDELDTLFAGNDANDEAKTEESSDHGNEVLNQDELDALFAGNNAADESKAEESSEDGNEVLNQDELDALFAGNNATEETKEESTDDGNEVLNQDELDALFAANAEDSSINNDSIGETPMLPGELEDTASQSEVDEVLAEGTPTVELSERVALTDDEKVVFEHPNDITQDLVDRLMTKVREQMEQINEAIKMPDEELAVPETADLHVSLEECQKAAHDLAEKRRHVEFDKDYDFYMSISREISEGDKELVEDFELDKAMEFVAKDNDIYSQKIVLPDEELLAPQNPADKVQLDFVEALEFSIGKHGHFIDKVQDKLNLVEDVIDNASTFVSDDALEKSKQVEEESLEEFKQEVQSAEQEFVPPSNVADLHLNLEEALSLMIGSVSEQRNANKSVEDTVDIDAQELDVDALPEKLSMDDIDSLFAANGDSTDEEVTIEDENTTLSADDIDSLFASNDGANSESFEVEEESTTLSTDDIDSLFAASSDEASKEVVVSEEDNTTLSIDDIDSLFADANGASEVEEAEEENATLSMDDIDNLFASAGESETMSEEKKELSETVSNAELDAVLNQEEVQVENEHPNDVEQGTVDTLMDEAKEKVESFEQEIIRHEEELVVPATADLHIQVADIQALNAFYGNEEPVHSGTSSIYDSLDAIEEEVTEEGATNLSMDDIDSLFASNDDSSEDAEDSGPMSADDIDSLFAASSDETAEEENSTLSMDDIDSLFASNDDSSEDADDSGPMSADDIDSLFASNDEEPLHQEVAEEHPNNVDQETIDNLMATGQRKS